MQAEDIKQLIQAALPDAEVTVTGDGDHFDATVVSASFRELSMVKQHQSVYAALGDRFRNEIHALSLHTYTPEQWARRVQ
ncbi:BolA family protein [Thiohalobacter sp. IOR34]|uniref:BolA family protein n=1 Tax=Thiohalobacter sp. IOR34 TaxID=3057176 RepID=UPI0025AF28BF|nr:BolA family protein [Thiohalobacter sp. IOR34]WJW74846.1 BolA family protein [Thiohalobacter sp. IOR34]